jgi:hypothetical protein
VTEQRKATPEELLRWRTRLSAWSNSSRFRRIVEHMRKRHGTHNLDQAGSPFREAFIAGRCAQLVGADAVRLGKDPPDFELQLGAHVRPFEVVEASAPGRRRGAELKAERLLPAKERAKSVQIAHDEWTQAEIALDQVRRAVARKRHHRYVKGTVLVVYLNIWPVAGKHRLSSGLAESVASAFDQFSSVWVLDGGDLSTFPAELV